MPLLKLDDMPEDPIAALMWLTGVMKQARTELDQVLASTYFEARLQGRFDEAVSAGPYARKKALALTRRENEARGRLVRWGDGQDPSSTAYSR